MSGLEAHRLGDGELRVDGLERRLILVFQVTRRSITRHGGLHRVGKHFVSTTAVQSQLRRSCWVTRLRQRLPFAHHRNYDSSTSRHRQIKASRKIRPALVEAPTALRVHPRGGQEQFPGSGSTDTDLQIFPAEISSATVSRNR